MCCINISYILPCDIDLVLTPQYLGPEWGERAISQDGQVTILDHTKAHGIAYMELYDPPTLYFSGKYSL